jgi:hypothetical protein
MKTTIDLPEDLVRALRIKAAEENRRLRDVVAEVLRRGLAAPARDEERPPHRVTLPLVHSSRPAPEGQALTAERVAEIEEQEDAEHVVRSRRS